MTQGKFITFEGGEGSGKSTQCKLLTDALINNNITTIQTREPGGTTGAETIRNLLVTGEANKWDAITETLLNFAARRDHMTNLIIPAITKGQYVISDRFYDSTLAYQGFGHQLGTNIIEQLQNLTISNFKPDLTIILDIAIEKGIARANNRGNAENRYEKMHLDFHKRVHEGFTYIAQSDPNRCHIIDATQSISTIHSLIIKIVNQQFNLSLTTTS